MSREIGALNVFFRWLYNLSTLSLLAQAYTQIDPSKGSKVALFSVR
jgi:hypothetical protein